MNKINNLTKFCSGCKENKNIKYEFNKHKNTKDGLQNYCKICKSKLNKNRKYGLKSGWFEETKIKQLNQCGICKKITQELLIDHCHKTGQLRALLCRKCNSVLGMSNDNILILQEAIKYLQKWTEE